MAGSSSVSGLASGLDTATIVSQLMQVEAAAQTRLKSRVTTEESTVTTLQKLNTKLSALATKAADLTKATAVNPMTATSSSDYVTATPRTGATAGSLSLVVNSVAATHRLTFTTSAALTDVVTGASTTVRLTAADGTTQDLDTGDGTLSGLIGALNTAGLRATTLKLDDGTYRLIVDSKTSGATGNFTLTALDGTDLLGGATVRAGQDAAITVGTDTVHSATNTFTGILPGVDVTIAANTPANTAVEITVESDETTAASSVQALVDAVNSVLDDLDTATKASASSAGALAGDAAARSLRTSLATAIYPTDGTSLASLGIQIDRNGRLVFDEDTFTAALAADPAKVTAAISGTGGFAARVQTIAKGASDSVDGTITSAITGRKAAIDRMEDSIADWDIRLALRKETLTRQFTAMETALSKLQAQSSWLASQIETLNNNSNSSSDS